MNAQFRIVRGSVQDYHSSYRSYREGWWWHCYTPNDYYSPEGPFLTKECARRHLLNTRRKMINLNTDRGWVKGFGYRTKKTMKPVPGTRFFGKNS